MFFKEEKTFSDEVFEDRLLGEQVDRIDGKLLNNTIVVEVEDFINSSIKAGDLSLWADNSYQPHEFVVRHGTVVNQPTKLVFWEDDDINGIRWRTELQTQIGDEVWFFGMGAHAAEKLTFEGRKFILLNYADLYVAKRGDEVICLNGNILLEPIYSHLKVLSYEKNDLDRLYAKVAYTGLKNTEYAESFRYDDDIPVGSTAIMSGDPYRYLELDPYFDFDGKKYIVAQNYEIRGWLE